MKTNIGTQEEYNDLKYRLETVLSKTNKKNDFLENCNLENIQVIKQLERKLAF